MCTVSNRSYINPKLGRYHWQYTVVLKKMYHFFLSRTLKILTCTHLHTARSYVYCVNLSGGSGAPSEAYRCTQKAAIASPPLATHPQLWAELHINVHVSIQGCILSHLHLHHKYMHMHASTHTLHAATDTLHAYKHNTTYLSELTIPELTIPLPLNPSGTPQTPR